MEGFILTLLIVLLVRWVVIARRLKKLQRRIEELSSSRGEGASGAHIRELAERVERLEMVLGEMSAAPSGPREAAIAKPELPIVRWPEKFPAEEIAVPTAAPEQEAVAPLAATPSPVPTAPTLAAVQPIPPRPSLLAVWSQRAREQMAGEEWEAVLGGSWLNRIGIAVLVIGVALFLGYSLRYMGPLGRVATGLVVSLALLIGGVSLEQVQRYTLFAKPLLGGGWALLYFTAYAAHNVEAAKVIQEPIWGLLLLGLVAAGMILHSLKYRSEVVTGLAYFLAFLTVATSQITGFTLVASFVLAASLVLVLRKTHWYYLGLFGIAATYFNHAIWLEFKMEGFAGGLTLKTFWLGQGMLILYWLLFTAFDFLLRPVTDKQERASIGVNLANTLAFLGLSFRQVWAVFPDSRHVLAGLAAFAYLVSSFILYSLRRRTPHLINAVVAASLIAIAIPLKPPASPLAKNWLGPAWLVDGAAVFTLGFYLREVVFRIQGYLLSLAAIGTIFVINLYSQPQPPHLLRWLTVSPAIAYLHYLFGRLHTSWRRGEVRDAEKAIGVVSCYVASALLAVLIWREVSLGLVGLAWLVAGVTFFEVGIRSQYLPFWRAHIRTQGYLLSVLALGAFYLINLYGFYGQEEVRGLSRWPIIIPAILAFYFLFWRLHRGVTEGSVPESEKRLADISSYAASALLTVLLWKELDPVAVALAWSFLGLLLFEAGIWFQQGSLKIQGPIIAAATLGRLFLANFTAPGSFFGLSHRVITVVPIIAIFYYLVQRLSEERAAGRILAFEKRLPQAYSYAAGFLLVVLARFELGRSLTVLAWALIGFIFLTLGISWRDRDLRIQACLLAILTFWRSWSTNFYLIGSFYGMPERIATMIPAIASLYASQLLCLRNRDVLYEASAGQKTRILSRLDAASRHLFSSLASLLLAILLYYQVRGNLLTVAWAIQGLGLMAAGFVIRERTFRLSGFGLFAVCLFKVFLIDLRGVETIYRIFSFIVLGIILLLVSFGYTRHRDVIKRYI